MYPLVTVSIVIGGVVRPKKLKTGDEVPWYSDPSSLHPANQQLKRRFLSKSTPPATDPSPPLLTRIRDWRDSYPFHWLRVTGQEWLAPSLQASYHRRLAVSLPPDTSTLDPRQDPSLYRPSPAIHVAEGDRESLAGCVGATRSAALTAPDDAGSSATARQRAHHESLPSNPWNRTPRGTICVPRALRIKARRAA